ncbi:uracil phosphoribosyltransferase (plasmid) [Acuticoccus sp. MNP-M23]|uniref:uracil phosphoribosyltransferase n=1 Tax=Acuticoccus sp. MNP-M23 TaxID=3072793 RepID=UPI0028151ECA|nr:uracil phosphoribosyltransferase [Acuticoccus sp. MNP-M23]WMS45341.1 uracil phosphoribosyltransferase [Acuticoccus sp. MNP-M23]
MSDPANFTLLEHPLITNKITLLREFETSMGKFGDLLFEIGAYFGFELTRDLPLSDGVIERFPDQAKVPVRRIVHRNLAVVPIMRSGLILAEGFRSVAKPIRTGHLGFSRVDPETYEVEPYLVALPDLVGRKFIVLDTVIATGHTMCKAVEIMHDDCEIEFENIVVASVLITPEGQRRIAERYPAVKVFATSMEDGLDSNNHVYPGFGDDASRLFGYF